MSMKRSCFGVCLACVAMCACVARAAEKQEQFHWQPIGWGGGGGFFSSTRQSGKT
jgi:hypothetical protein